ncbi:phage tape measure protein [Caballeronia pedi]|uniref:Phage tape measure protein n=1 Tax=Caballeronia pedi TaxID=1777141 RepID=A0A158BHC4_9BURK|nr:phage tail length tape measure family protein [Caballeronia pedi]SAK69461.1 phage tape measure protein [Caballeronia pedi]
MASEVVTRVSVDASGFEAGMEKVSRAARGFVANQEATSRKYEACQQQMAASSALTARALEEAVRVGSAATARQVSAAVKGFEKIAGTAGKTRFDLMRLKAANLGIAESAEPLIAKAEAASRAMHHLGAGSVAARRELFVLGHEAMQGSWKNFVGSLMVLAERIDVLPLLCGPAGIALGALGASAFATYHAIHELTEQQEKLDRAMALTGNYAALTQGKLQAYSDIISRRVGVSLGDARDALMALANSGHVAGADLEHAAEGIAAFAKASGQSVDEVVRQFLQSYGHATQAARDWNEKHHDLSKEQLDHIRILDLSGDKAGAWAAFVEAASKKAREAVQSDNREMAESYETLGQKWDRVWRGITGKGDALQKAQDELKAARGALLDPELNPGGMNTAEIERRIADAQRLVQSSLRASEQNDPHQKSVETFKAMMNHHAEYMKQARTPKEQLADANKETNEYFDAVKRAGEAAGKTREELRTLDAERQKMLAHNEERYRPHTRAVHAPRIDAGARYLERIREQGAALEAQSRTTDKLTNAQKELAQFNEKMAAAKRHIASAEERSLQHSEKAIRAQLEQNAALEKANKLGEARAKFEERAQHVQQSMREFRQAREQRYARELGERDADRLGRDERRDLNEATTRYQRALEALKKGASVELLNSIEYLTSLAEIEREHAKAIEDAKKHYDELRRLQGDWAGGAKRGVADFFKDTQGKAELARRAVVAEMGRMEDAVAKFVTTGKLNVKEFVASLLADISKLALHQALGGLTDRIPFLKLVGHAQGGLITGPGTGTSDSIPAMLSNGEYVVNADAARQHHALLDAINSKHIAHFASGGLVGNLSGAGPRFSGAQVHLEVNHHGSGGLSEHDLRELLALVGGFVDQRMARKMGGQGGVASLISQGHFG